MARSAFFPVFIIAAKVIVTGLAFWLILRSVDVAAAAQAMQSASPGSLVVAFFLLLAQVAINGVRWSLIARSTGILLTPIEAMLRFWESLFFGQLTPSGVGGDAWRVYAAARNGSAVVNAVNSVILDRMLGVTALLIMVFCGFLGELLHGDAIDAIELAVGSGLIGIMLIGVFLILTARRLPERTRSWDKWQIVFGIKRVSTLFAEGLRRPGLVATALVLSVVGQVLCAMSVWILARAIGFDPGLLVSIVVVPLALLIALVPVTIAGWGLREGVLAAGLVRAGASLEVGAAAALLFGIGLAFIGLTGGICLWLTGRGQKPSPS